MTGPIRKIIYISPDDIKPHPRNPRKHSRKQVRAIASSMRAFGVNVPLLVDAQMQLIAGHGRLDAAKFLGLSVVPVICLDDLSETQAQAYMLADNQLGLLSTWDDQLLAIHLKELSSITVDFALEDTGFEFPEIDLRIQALDENPADAADEFEEPGGPCIARPGDCFHLDGHRIYCGDALRGEPYDIFSSLPKPKAVFADPPYNVKIDGHASGLGRIRVD